MAIEILHQRDSDGGCALTVFVDGKPADYISVDVDPGRGWTREDWEESKTYVAGPDVDLTPEFRAAVFAAYAEVPDTYIDSDGWIKLDLEITNVYEDGEQVVNHVQTWAPEAPDEEDEEEFEEWGMDHIFPLTGTGRTEGDAGYFAEVKAVRDDNLREGEHPLVGHTFEYGI